MARGFETTTGLVIQQGIFEESATAKHKIGTRMQLVDGRVFFYGSVVEAVIAGNLCFSKPPHAAYTAMVTTTASAAVGAKTITGMTVGAEKFTANEFAEGYVITQKVSGTGNCYKIKSHTSGTSGGTNLNIVLYDPIQQAILTTTELTFCYNPWYNMSQGTTTVTSPPAGVPLRAFTIAYYGWVQTWGICALQHDEAGSLTIGMRLHASTEEGAVASYTTSTETTGGGKIYPHVGYNFGQVAVDAEWTPVMLQLHP